MIFVLLGRSNALCLARHNRAKSAEIHRFKAGSDLSLYPIISHKNRTVNHKLHLFYFLDINFFLSRSPSCQPPGLLHTGQGSQARIPS